VPIKIVGYSWPKEFEPKKTLPEVRRNTMRPAAEQACRELALPSVIASTPSLARAELLGLAVTGNSTDLQCTMTFGSVADLGLASVGYQKAFDQRIFEIRDCPANATASGKLGDANRTCQCDRGFQEDPTHSACHKAKENTCENDQKKGNPILPGTAEKFRAEDDILEGGPSPLNFGRIYRSTWASSAIYSDATPSSMGGGWRHSHAMSLEATPANAPSNVVVTTADGSERHFSRAAGAASWTAYNSTDRLVQMGNDDWMYTRTDDDVTFTFDKVGRLLSRTERNGWITRYTYDKAGQLTTITNPFGRSRRLAYDTGGRVASVTMPDARTVSYGYDVEKRLTSVRYPDGRGRGFLYENLVFPNALTGLLDENGARFATFTYDKTGRAISTELTGGVACRSPDHVSPTRWCRSLRGMRSSCWVRRGHCRWRCGTE
jgi:YD repeat-containing protein